MKRLLFLALLVPALGCNEKRLQAAQARIDAANKARAAFESAKVYPLEVEVQALRDEMKAIDNKRASDERNLELMQETLVAGWSGSPELMKKQIAEAKVPAALVPALERAQTDRGDTARERVFADALAKNDLARIATAISGWESRVGVDTEADAAEAPEPATVECNKVSAKVLCESFKLDSGARVLCHLDKASMWWAVGVDHGALQLSELSGAYAKKYVPLRVPTPKVWLLEATDPAGLQTNVGLVKRWIEAYELGDASSKRTVQLPLEMADGHKGHLSQLDVDADGIDETVYVFGDELKAFHTVGASDVVIWNAADVCDRLSDRTPPADVKPICDKLAKK